MKARAIFLDAKTIGEDISLQPLHEVSDITILPSISDDEVLRACRGLPIIVTNKIPFDRKRLEALSPDLRLICLTATGYNNVDIPAANELGIVVCNVRGYSTTSVAQHTIGMALALLQQLEYYHHFVVSGAYSRSKMFTNFERTWYELEGKTWGIIGMGAIGKKVAEVASVLGCNIAYYSTSGKNTTQGYTHLALADLLGQSHIVSIHAPLNNATRNLINAEKLSYMKKDAILINAGRGGIVAEDDLAETLLEGGIRGAALDVFSNEPIEADSPLLQLPEGRILLSPHAAWGSTEARTRVIEGVAKNIRAYLNGKPQNTVG